MSVEGYGIFRARLKSKDWGEEPVVGIGIHVAFARGFGTETVVFPSVVVAVGIEYHKFFKSAGIVESLVVGELLLCMGMECACQAECQGRE